VFEGGYCGVPHIQLQLGHASANQPVQVTDTTESEQCHHIQVTTTNEPEEDTERPQPSPNRETDGGMCKD
jgi:hypothetical protein